MLATRQDLDLDHVITRIWLFFFWLVGISFLVCRIDEASAQVFRLLKVEEAQVAICECTDHIRLKLMHSNSEALLLRHNEVEAVL